MFKEEHGRYPDLVVLHSNYWDIAQIVLFRQWDAPEWEYVRYMQPWLSNAAKVAAFLKVRCPAPLCHQNSTFIHHRCCSLVRLCCWPSAWACRDHLACFRLTSNAAAQHAN